MEDGARITLDRGADRIDEALGLTLGPRRLVALLRVERMERVPVERGVDLIWRAGARELLAGERVVRMLLAPDDFDLETDRDGDREDALPLEAAATSTAPQTATQRAQTAPAIDLRVVQRFMVYLPIFGSSVAIQSKRQLLPLVKQYPIASARSNNFRKRSGFSTKPPSGCL